MKQYITLLSLVIITFVVFYSLTIKKNNLENSKWKFCGDYINDVNIDGAFIFGKDKYDFTVSDKNLVKNATGNSLGSIYKINYAFLLWDRKLYIKGTHGHIIRYCEK